MKVKASVPLFIWIDNMELISENKVAQGWHRRYQHESPVLNCSMNFAVFLPPQASKENPVPVLYWLSGLTCTDENFMQKAGAFKAAAQAGIAIVAPDTSPRGEGVADNKSYDLGQGAGFYLDATQAPWSKHYQMYSYITKELPELIESQLPVTQVKSIAGHSMGGHGALTIGIKNSKVYHSISAFSPISNPTQCPWGIKAFTHYLGQDTETWHQYDASLLLAKAKNKLPILVEQGSNDDFLREQLKPDTLKAAAKEQGTELQVNMREGYDHSYFFISTFIDDHINFHSKYLNS